MAVISRSPAARLLDDRIAEVITLVRLCPPTDSDPPTRDEARRTETALCRSALVLLCSHMEGFFEDLVEDVLAFHEANETIIASLPVALRVRQAVVQVRTLAEPGSDDARRWGVIQSFRTETVFDDTKRCSTGLLDPALHTGKFASPGSEELARLFASVGFHNLWQEINARPRGTLLKASLDAVVYRRHEVAHGNIEATITPADLIGYVDDMRELADRSDVVIGEWLESDHGRKNPWAVLL